MSKISNYFKSSDSGKLSRGRYGFIDLLKGIMIISVVLYHFCWDLADIAGIESVRNFMNTTPAWYWQQISCGTFIFLSGVCTHFSRSNIKNGARVLGFGIIITVVTYVAEIVMALTGLGGGVYIWFGILHFIGAACLIMGLCEKFFKKIPAFIGAPLCLILYLLTRGIYIYGTGASSGYIGLTFGPHASEQIVFFRLPSYLYSFQGMEIFGFRTADFSSSDYFPIIPWIFLFLSGYYFWTLIKNGKFVKKTKYVCVPPLNAIGRNTIWVYLFHQPVLIVITALIALAMGKL